jgi:hypothetical protein
VTSAENTAWELRELAAKGVREFKAGRCDALRFDLFNGAEVAEVQRIMREHYPDVPFTWTAVTIADRPDVKGGAR